MRKMLVLLLLVCVHHATAVAADQPATNSPEAATQFFASLAGQWACTGTFANGKPLAADITFTPKSEGRALLYHHQDRAPTNFIQDALWGPDAANHSLVSLTFAGNPQVLAPQLFVAESWTTTSIVFEAKALTSPPFAPNRFTYRLDDPNTLKMIWEVQRQGAWSMGDQLTCKR